MNIAKGKYLLLICCLFMATSVLGRDYEIPPSSTTSINVPYISDAAMEQCVKLYNEAKWLAETIDKTVVNEYSQVSVDSYNAKVTQHSKMLDHFNKNCAGKQSESAYKAAQKLNQQQNQ